ncbi:MAG: acetylxylan esterase [Anaerolineae bacterium]|nr:acetylxylan esterase [Anaerolineae bacterium]
MQEPNYDESKIPQYHLPDPLIREDGHAVSTASEWLHSRRHELLAQFERSVYGCAPDTLPVMSCEVTDDESTVMPGKPLRRQVTIKLTTDQTSHAVHLLMYIPVTAQKKPVPAFLALNFRGNHSIHADPGIHAYPQWVQHPVNGEARLHQPQAEERGSASSRWAVETIIENGYALVTAHYGDLDPDFDDGFMNGVHTLFPRDNRGGNAWGSISAWAWGLSRIMDYIETDTRLDHKKVAVLGHSRLGKTALWAGAQDSRFAVIISNESGCGGAALSRRKIGETVQAINECFPHWFCTNFRAYNDLEDKLPVDQHQLIALLAPRPVYIASAVDDCWSDPVGEFLAARHADPVYKLLGTAGLPVQTQPPLNQPVMGQIGYHIRAGSHDVTAYDWEQFIKFTDMHLRV